jgi:hypothetical protein
MLDLPATAGTEQPIVAEAQAAVTEMASPVRAIKDVIEPVVGIGHQ